jgi:hypothetical protein
MAEKLASQPEAPRHNPEAHNGPEQHRTKEHEPKTHERAKHEQHERLSASREAVERQAKSSEDISRSAISGEHHTAAPPPPTRELQEMAKDRLLRTIRRGLPAPEKALSKFMHTKPVEALSSAGEKTVARPYGLLGGGLAAFIGSALTFYMAKHYGFRYNLLLFFTFFVGGYIIATVLEVIVKTVRRAR